MRSRREAVTATNGLPQVVVLADGPMLPHRRRILRGRAAVRCRSPRRRAVGGERRVGLPRPWMSNLPVHDLGPFGVEVDRGLSGSLDEPTRRALADLLWERH